MIGTGLESGGPYGVRAATAGGPQPAAGTAGDVLAGYLHRQSAQFLRSLRSHGESGPDAAGAAQAARQLRHAARRISGALHTFRPLADESWADQLRAELGWLSVTLAREHAYAARAQRLVAALQRLTGPTEAAGRPGEGPAAGDAGGGVPAEAAAAALAAGAARAGALLDRQLTLARTRAHSAALQALGSSRFHAVADAVAVLASEAPLDPAMAARPAAEALPPLAEQAHQRLAEAVAALPLARAGHPYDADALAAGQQQDAPWHQVRQLVRLSRYATEVTGAHRPPADRQAPDEQHPGEWGRAGRIVTEQRLAEAGRALERHRDAAEAAAAAAAAARTPRIAPATAYALGVLHADQRREVEAARFAFGRVWLPAPAADPLAGPARR